jgi:LysM repeat protein
LLPKESKKNRKEVARLEKIFLKKNSGYFTYHIVKKGDNLWKIARKYKMSVAKIMALNNLKTSTIRPGQKLRLYGSTNVYNKRYYTVKRGDSLYKISKKLKISVAKLIRLNNLRKNKNGHYIIRPGQKLKY